MSRDGPVRLLIGLGILVGAALLVHFRLELTRSAGASALPFWRDQPQLIGRIYLLAGLAAIAGSLRMRARMSLPARLCFVGVGVYFVLCHRLFARWGFAFYQEWIAHPDRMSWIYVLPALAFGAVGLLLIYSAFGGGAGAPASEPPG